MGKMLVPEMEYQDSCSLTDISTVREHQVMRRPCPLEPKDTLGVIAELKDAGSPAEEAVKGSHQGTHHRPPMSKMPTTISAVPSHWAGEIGSRKTQAAART